MLFSGDRQLQLQKKSPVYYCKIWKIIHFHNHVLLVTAKFRVYVTTDFTFCNYCYFNGGIVHLRYVMVV